MQTLWSSLLAQYSNYPSLLVAFSGGVDSALVARAAREAVTGPVRLVFCRNQLITKEEEQQAQCLAQELNLPFSIVELDVLALAEVKHNRPQRCYVCKRALFSRLRQLADEWNLAAVADGSNADDKRSDNRPGNRAGAELGIAQPLAAAGLSKAQARQLAQWLGLSNHAQAARPCLATRFPYHTELDPALLQRVAQGEQLLRQLGLRELRLRCHGEICRIEATAADQELIFSESAHIAKTLTALGWRFVTLDLGGLQSGCFD